MSEPSWTKPALLEEIDYTKDDLVFVTQTGISYIDQIRAGLLYVKGRTIGHDIASGVYVMPPRIAIGLIGQLQFFVHRYNSPAEIAKMVDEAEQEIRKTET